MLGNPACDTIRWMTQQTPVSYSPIEVRGYLPGGWSLATEPDSQESANPDSWSVTLIDIADMEWPLTVSPRDVEKLGRIEALRQAIDRIYRKARA